MAGKPNNQLQRSVVDFFVKTKSKETFSNSLSQSNENSESTPVLQNTIHRSFYLDCLDEEFSTIENNNSALDMFNESSNSVIYDQSCDEFSGSTNAENERRSNSVVSKQLNDESSNGTDAVSLEVVSNYICDNRECLELKAKYDKLKQAYAKSLTVNLSNTEKVHEYEKEIENLKILKETVS